MGDMLAAGFLRDMVTEELGLGPVLALLCAALGGGHPACRHQQPLGRSPNDPLGEFVPVLALAPVVLLAAMLVLAAGAYWWGCGCCGGGEGYPGQRPPPQGEPPPRPAPPGALAMVDTFTEEEGAAERQESCAVCVECMLTGQRLSRLPCGHEFHARCLLTWLQRADTCPTCRSKLTDTGSHEPPPARGNPGANGVRGGLRQRGAAIRDDG